MSHKKYNRRSFLSDMGKACTGMGATAFLSGLTNLGLMNAAAAANRSIFHPNNEYKALVCILLHGGNDSYNMLMPRGIDEHKGYEEIRGEAAIPREEILPITALNPDGKEYGVHPNLPGIKALFDQRKLSFIANVGTLVRPTSMNDFRLGQHLPKRIFSHSDQQEQWQTSMPDRDSITGWTGRMADILRYNNTNQNISMNISLAGMNLYQQGASITPMAIKADGTGVTLVNGSNNMGFYESLKRQTLDNLMENTYQNILHQAYTHKIKSSKSNSFEFDAIISNTPEISTTFPNHYFSNNLKMVARTIAARDALGVTNQTFFVQIGGFDNHGSYQQHYTRMAEVNQALTAFYQSLVDLGVEENVVTFTISDFARTLAPNGQGVDHAWGGNAMVMGGAVDGGKIFGQYPDLYKNGHPLDVGRGRLIPTTSVDEYFADLALWFGASHADIDQILPNIGNFWEPASGGAPLGIMR
ncbi:MAG: DUF1501 domain-containing protein [Bacteroidota bacterium]